MTLSLERRIDRLEARAAIAELCALYCLAVDRRDMALLEGCLTEDVQLTSQDGLIDATDRAAALRMYTKTLSVRGPSYHWTHDHVIQFDDADPDVATGRVFAHAETTPNGATTVTGFYYDDRYRRENGQWRFAARALTFLYYIPVEQFADRFPKEQRVWMGGNWR